MVTAKAAGLLITFGLSTCGRGAGSAHLCRPAPTKTPAAPDEHACEMALQYSEAGVGTFS